MALGVALLCAVTTSTLAAVSFTLTVESDFWVREVELVGGGRGLCCGRGCIQCAAGSQQRDDDHKKGRTKKRFIEKTPP